MPYYVLATGQLNRYFGDVVTAADIINALEDNGFSSAEDFTNENFPLTQVGDAAQLRPGGAVLMGWTDEQSRIDLTTDLRQFWKEDVLRISIYGAPTADGALYGVKLIGDNEFMVVGCEDRFAAPGPPWQTTIQYDEVTQSILISDFLS